MLPLPRTATAGLAFLVALMEVGTWIMAATQFDFDDGLQLGTSYEWVESLGISYSVGFYGFSLWLAGAAVIVSAAAIGYALWVGRDRPRAYRTDALPERRRIRHLRRAGPPALLRLLRGDADPAVRPRRRVGVGRVGWPPR